MTDKYLKRLVSVLNVLLDSKLMSVYVIGSLCTGDFSGEESDIDVLAIVSRTLSENENVQLAEALNVNNLPCPTAGLDIVIITIEEATRLKAIPTYEFWYASGKNWPEQSWQRGANKEMLVFLELARCCGIKIYDSVEDVKPAMVPKTMIVKSFLEILAWHEVHILDSYHDPGGCNSVLNACRMLAFIKTNVFHSKTAGGHWFQKQYRSNKTVEKALKKKHDKKNEDCTETEIILFLQWIKEEIAKVNP
ncbi:MAG TPA: DUF4111 domain-containing protein [Saprospiraceae bacterium]|nr:DUF4111 domain-containing protein [Saprospiraceae bacterium]HRG20739.1 DUF4111 domain-containing protein [Saprospiraceae bacterium]